jgi:hypothetical protein
MTPSKNDPLTAEQNDMVRAGVVAGGNRAGALRAV